MIGMNRPQAHPPMFQLADHGWICVSISAIGSARNTRGRHIVDVKRTGVVKAAHRRLYGGDPTLYITGGLAGGHLSSLAALGPPMCLRTSRASRCRHLVAGARPIYGRYD